MVATDEEADWFWKDFEPCGDFGDVVGPALGVT